ncbi:histidine phosphatase family protein [Streptococcus suis]|uniref:histidine phosphatase family protein n=1 Tax=Streptococcus suis TaxID=1307 RepID=UPI00196132A3|nr:histidine phosphatase family protein [Streptococcus suis]MBM7137226.1 histidine phosphatase family protein [Streptococcus suis]MBY4601571.1 histidine phosphatase family protein [Streptococcus suis]MCO8183644.1 histidine phosphatase family protein [Streptococcus suis]MCO8201552.1 histidine phosphatase family protein [Streptococcus suis]MCO8215312.1 histidine phosphatase family protein [Streptococcus suis]
MVKTIYLMRHGETLFNTQGRVQGVCDSPLTENGRAQAQAAKNYFAEQGVQFGAVYSSTQERATDTAKIVSGQENVQQLKGLKEMDFGIFEAQPEMLLPKFRPGANSFEDLLVPFGGEDICTVGQRVAQTVEETASGQDEKTVLAVSHGAAMWGFMLHHKIELPADFRFSNCVICQLEYDGDQIRLVKVINPVLNQVIDL